MNTMMWIVVSMLIQIEIMIMSSSMLWFKEKEEKLSIEKTTKKKASPKIRYIPNKKGKLMFLTSPQIHFDDRSCLELSGAGKKF